MLRNFNFFSEKHLSTLTKILFEHKSARITSATVCVTTCFPWWPSLPPTRSSEISSIVHRVRSKSALPPIYVAAASLSKQVRHLQPLVTHPFLFPFLCPSLSPNSAPNSLFPMTDPSLRPSGAVPDVTGTEANSGAPRTGKCSAHR